MEKPDTEKPDAQEKGIAGEPGEQVKEWMENEGTDFDDGLKAPKTMAQDARDGKRGS